MITDILILNPSFYLSLLKFYLIRARAAIGLFIIGEIKSRLKYIIDLLLRTFTLAGN